MGKVLFNRRLSADFYLLRAREKNSVKMGQFYMVRAWERYPVLSRPISVFDADGETVTLLYKVIGGGTELLTRLREGDEITLNGPYGNGFPNESGKIALVGGGVGVAPLYLAAKTLKQSPGSTVDLFLGFSGEEVLREEFRAVADSVTVNVGGFVTDAVEPENYDVILSCGPEIMMRVLYKKCKGSRARVYACMESRMACGVGACLVCSCKTKAGNRRVCRDGPVFLAEEVFADE